MNNIIKTINRKILLIPQVKRGRPHKININKIQVVKQKKIKIYKIPKNIRKNNINKLIDYLKNINFTISFEE